MIKTFEFEELDLKDAYLIKPFISQDNRGFFIKDYSKEIFNKMGIDHDLMEAFYTVSKQGVIRALHFQEVKEQAKLVRCIKGRIFDVIVDLRVDSPTFKQWKGFYLDDKNNQQILVPKHFAHGYLVLEESIVSYKCAEKFYGEYDSGIMWNDPEIKINWPLDELPGGIESIIISDKDENLESFKKWKENIDIKYTF